MDALIQTLIDYRMTALVNFLQVLGVLVMVRVYFGLRQLRIHYSSVGRVPEHLAHLKRMASKIIEYLNNFEGSQVGLHEEITKLEVTLKALRKHLAWTERTSVRKALASIRDFGRRATDEHARSIYLDIQRIVAELEERERDSRWR